MKKHIFMILMLLFSIKTYSQKKNTVGISIPIIWNNSEATFYSGQKDSGSDISYGINLNYQRNVYKGLFITTGIGYFKQNFSIVRPFKFDTPNRPLYHTKNYSYHTLQLLSGLGYKQSITNDFTLVGMVTYNIFNSFKQRYDVNESVIGSSFQINNKNIFLGSMINTSLGIEKKIKPDLYVNLTLLMPIYIKWNKDDIFIEYQNIENTQQIAKNKFSIGTTLSFNYHF